MSIAPKQTIPLAALLDLAALRQAPEAAPAPFREALKAADAALTERFLSGTDAAALVEARAGVVDALLRAVWPWFIADPNTGPALVAVGGYGRGELHPASDIDLLILLDGPAPQWDDPITRFITFLWDMGLEPGHAVRDLGDCAREAEADLTVITNLMEARLLAGPEARFLKMRAAIDPTRLWPVQAFFEAKLEEQRRRHLKFGDTAYRLEPNVKEGPGGLRDLQIIAWVFERATGAAGFEALTAGGYLTELEYQGLMESRALLWRVRFALHALTGRREERLLFDQQIAVAEALGYEDRDHNLAVERFMQAYYQAIVRLSRLSEMLLQLFREHFLLFAAQAEPIPVNSRFRIRHGSLEVAGEQIFRRYPFALLELFLVMAQHPEIQGVRAETIRLLRRHRHRIDARFRADLRNHSLFMKILRQPKGITHELRRMNRYGVLARYIPAFGAVVGRMQYDLFHAYTVDEHTLFVLRNARRFFIFAHDDELPLASRVARDVAKPELLYLACLFHDIAKGRGGDHSALGAEDARRFCRQHGLGRFDTRLVAWLVQHHLLMSGTAQRKDIADPNVIQAFAEQVGDETHLRYLYLLTVADIRGTNPDLWNTWKDALLRELYLSALRAIRRGLGRPIDPEQRIREIKQEARIRLHSLGMSDPRINKRWQDLNGDYFLRHSAEEIAWQEAEIDRQMQKSSETAQSLVRVRHDSLRGSTAVFVHWIDHNHRFARITSLLDQMHLTIVEARIISGTDGRGYDTYQVLEANGAPIETPQRQQAIQARIAADLDRREETPVAITRRTPRRIKAFDTPTTVTFYPQNHNEHTLVEIIAGDHPGLLSRIGQAFAQCDIQIHSAKVATIGERAEDLFLITDAHQRPIENPEYQERIRQTLEALL